MRVACARDARCLRKRSATPMGFRKPQTSLRGRYQSWAHDFEFRLLLACPLQSALPRRTSFRSRNREIRCDGIPEPHAFYAYCHCLSGPTSKIFTAELSYPKTFEYVKKYRNDRKRVGPSQCDWLQVARKKQQNEKIKRLDNSTRAIEIRTRATQQGQQLGGGTVRR